MLRCSSDWVDDGGKSKGSRETIITDGWIADEKKTKTRS